MLRWRSSLARRRARPCSPRTILGATGDGRGRGSWGSSSGVLAITRGPESKMSAALSGGDRSEERNASSASHATPSTGTSRSIVVVSACSSRAIIPLHRGLAKALTLQRLPSRVIVNATQEFVKPRCRFPADFRGVFVLAGRARGRAAQLLAGLAHRGARLIDDAGPT